MAFFNWAARAAIGCCAIFDLAVELVQQLRRRLRRSLRICRTVIATIAASDSAARVISPSRILLILSNIEISLYALKRVSMNPT
jgi:hypothetical protein